MTAFLAALIALAAASTAEPEGAGRTGFWAMTGSFFAGSQALSAGRTRLTGPPGGP